MPLRDKIEVLETAFWREFRDELKIEEDCIGVRNEWKVVEEKKEKRDQPSIEIVSVGMGSFGDFLGMLSRR